MTHIKEVKESNIFNYRLVDSCNDKKILHELYFSYHNESDSNKREKINEISCDIFGIEFDFDDAIESAFDYMCQEFDNINQNDIVEIAQKINDDLLNLFELKALENKKLIHYSILYKAIEKLSDERSINNN